MPANNLLDVLPWQRVPSGWAREAAMAAAFSLGYLVLTLPVLAFRSHLPPFSGADYAIATARPLIATISLLPLG